MPAKIEDLVEGLWWIQHYADPTRQVVVSVQKGTRGNWAIGYMGSHSVDQNIGPYLDRLLAPVAPYREKNSLIVIGWLSMRYCYLNLTREEAIARFIRDHEPEMTPEMVTHPGDGFIDEYLFDDEFGAYDAWTDERFAAKP